MTVTFDPAVARRRFENEQTQELVRLAYVNADELLEEALALVKAELLRRGVDGEEHPLAVEAKNAVEARQLASETRAQKPAHVVVLLLSFVFADIFAVVAALLYQVSGRPRAAISVWKAFALGWIARILLIAYFTFPWGSSS
jgi:hypothetical protein